MMNDSLVLDNILHSAVARAADEIPGANFHGISQETHLYGSPSAILDSLNLVSFVFIIEEEFESKSGRKLKITTPDVLDAKTAPFKNLTSLRQFLETKLSGK